MVKPVHTPLSYRIRAELFTPLLQMEIAGLPFDKAVSRSKKGPALFFFKTIDADPFDSLQEQDRKALATRGRFVRNEQFKRVTLELIFRNGGA